MKITILINHIDYTKLIDTGCQKQASGAVRMLGGLGARIPPNEVKQELAVKWVERNHNMLIQTVNEALRKQEIVATVETIDCVALGENLIASATFSCVDVDAIATKYLPVALAQCPDQGLMDGILGVLSGQEYAVLLGALGALEDGKKIALLTFFVNKYQSQILTAINQAPIAKKFAVNIASASIG